MAPTSKIATLIAIATYYHGASAQSFADCDLSNYYSTLLSSPLSTSRADMHTLLKNTHRDQLPYSSSSYGDVWDALIALDSDTYDESGNVKLVYKDISVPAIPYDFGTCEYWNREHLWSRSHGVGSSGKDNTDLHHLRPSDCNVNSARNNLYFGACGTARPSAECTSPAHAEAAVDTEKDASTFLPPANVRGDIARAILYMDLRYEGDEGSTTLDLVVSDCPETVANGAGMGYLSQLLKWHLEDPPDAEERARNEMVCADWQGNRNPFVDYPALASIYHGGSRPLIGDGLGYDCTVPPPPAGTCSDSSGPCSSVGECLCSSSSTGRKLLEARASSNLRSETANLRASRKLQASKLIITGVIDGPLSGGLPKAIELYALGDISDLSAYSIGSANNGGGTDGEEFTLSGSTTAGSFITVASESTQFNNYFGESPTFISGAANLNGDDAVELFYNAGVVDTFGEIAVDGTGQVWEYMDGWAYRHVGSSPGGSTFELTEWDFSGKNGVDGCSSNGGCASIFPVKSFVSGTSTSSPTPSPTQASKLIITGVIDGPLSGGLPKAIELYALGDISDLSAYSIGSANNGGGTDGEEFTLSGSTTAGSFITVSYESTEFNNYFGESPTFTSGAANLNGDDAVELFYNAGVVDTFGEIAVDGSGQVWEYMDGWAYRHVGSSPGGSTFELTEWDFSGKNGVDGCSSNGSCASIFPVKSFVSGTSISTPPPSPTPEPCECLISA